MGKWTPNYVDDVLHGKVSNLVSGSIRRASVEKEPSISYENFVHELDTGDSFTTTIIDILVKELADRRTRSVPGDRTLISDRTSRSLRRLANAGRTYPVSGRFGVPRNPTASSASASLETYMVDSPDADDDYDDLMMGDMEAMEGTRSQASNLYDAFAPPPPWPSAGLARRFPGSPTAEWPMSATAAAALPRPSWSLASQAGANLSRQASVRRAIRTRLSDTMAERRRSHAREYVSHPGPRSPTTGLPELIDPPHQNGAGVTVRRFFPRSRRNETTVVSPWADNAGVDATGSSESDDQGPQFVVSLADWHAQEYPDTAVRRSPDGEDPAETERLLRAPRLPRSELSSGFTAGLRQHQPRIDEFFHAQAEVAEAPAATAAAAPPPREEAPNAPAPEEVVGYPTPGSTENENIS